MSYALMDEALSGGPAGCISVEGGSFLFFGWAPK